ncbi:unnamed protein product [Ectocarpus sp. 6 AP-2014]
MNNDGDTPADVIGVWEDKGNNDAGFEVDNQHSPNGGIRSSRWVMASPRLAGAEPFLPDEGCRSETAVAAVAAPAAARVAPPRWRGPAAKVRVGMMRRRKTT